MKKITVDLLEEHKACKKEIELFKQFLDGNEFVLATEFNIQAAFKYGLNVVWASDVGLIKLDGCYESADGDKYWFQNGKRHCVDGPAVEYANGSKFWYQNGDSHRLDGPACEYASGAKEWYQNGKLHRLDGPAVEYAHAGTEWRVNGLLHRLDGPAVEYADGTKSWFQNGQLHRLDGPAIEHKGGVQRWYINGQPVSEKKFKLKMKLKSVISWVWKNLYLFVILTAVFVPLNFWGGYGFGFLSGIYLSNLYNQIKGKNDDK